MRKKLLPFIAIIMLAFVGACSNEDALPEVGTETNPEITGRTLSFTASMPDEDSPATRVNVEEGADRTIELTWNATDKIDLLFVQGINKINESITVESVDATGKNATFTVPIPVGISEGEPFNLYGVYGGGEVSTTNPELIKLPAIEGTTLNEENVGKKVMLRFANTIDATGVVGAVNFEHVGFLFTAKIKVTNVILDGITSVKLVGADSGSETWAYNASANHLNLETGEFTNEGTGTNAVSFQNVVKDATNNILTVRNWFPAIGTAWPALQLSINGTTETVDTKPSRTPAVGKAYYLYATWDGTDLAFASRADVEPADGTKEKPYSVAEAIADVYVDGVVVKDKWIRGFIVGSYNNGSIFGINNPSEFNLNIANDKDATNGADVVNVQLTTTKDIRATFNLINNPGMYKAEVLFMGDIEKYNGLPGLKQTSDFVVISTTPLFEADNTPITFTSSLDLTETIAITTNDTQAWTAASSDETWLTVAPANGTGSGSITITATENINILAGRTATVTLSPTDNAEVAPIVINVTQDKLVSLINVDPTSLVFTTASGAKTLTVNSNITWTASATIVDGEAGWLTITPTEGNNGETTITATATANTTFAVRKATINITDGAGISLDVDVTQAAVIPFINVDPTILALGKDVVTDEPVTITANVNWSAEVNAEATWLIISPASGANNGTILVSAEANSGADARNATITIIGGGLTKTVAVTQAGTTVVFATDLFFSEYIEGSSNNKYLEIYNGTGAPVELTDYEVVLYSNGATERGNNIQLTGTLAQGGVFVIANSSGSIYSGADATSTVTYFNGDDAVALQRISTGDYVDIIGRIGEQVKWNAGGNLRTENRTLIRKPDVTDGVTINPSSGFPTLATEWIGHPQDYQDLGKHTTSY